MIHRIFSDLPQFKTLELRQGLNLLLSDRLPGSTDQQTRNRAGKTSLIQLIHFVLGSSANPQAVGRSGSIFRKSELENHRFGMTFDLAGERVTAERSGKHHGRVAILEGETAGWPVQPSTQRGVTHSLSNSDWCGILGLKMFGIPYAEDRVPYSPSFRSLISYFVRRETEGGFRKPESQSIQMSAWDQQVAIAYMLGLDWKIAQDWEIVRQREKALKELRKAAGAGAFGGFISSSAQLRTQLVIAERDSQRLHEALARFEVLPEYRELEKEASTLTRSLNEASNENTLDEQLLQEMRAATQTEASPDPSIVVKLYEEAGITLPTLVSRRFEEVSRFHQSVVRNRRDYLTAEIQATEDRIAARRESMRRMDTRRAEIMTMLKSHGALDQFQKLQEESNRQDAQTESIRQRFQAAEQLEGSKTELEIDRGRLLLRLRRDIDEQATRVNEAVTAFETISEALYEEAGSLSLTPTSSGLKPEITIQGQRSRGIQNMQIFCFDLMLMKLCADRGTGPGFLIHDSHLFDGVDGRQVGKALQLGKETAEACGWQYLVTMNSDALPTEIPEGFDLQSHILPTRLTDATEDGGLFGFRFS